jgi:hypothetical protein
MRPGVQGCKGAVQASALAAIVCVLGLTAFAFASARSEKNSAEARLQALEDIQSLERLQNVYGYYVDKRLFDQVVELFAEDSSVEISHRGVYVGKAGVRRMFVDGWAKDGLGLRRGQLFNHLMLQPVVDILPGGRKALGRFRTFAQVGSSNSSVMWVEGVYENEFVKEGGAWKFSKMKFWPSYYVPEREGFTGKTRPNIELDPNNPPDRPPTDDAGVFPDVYYPPFHYPNPVTGKPVDVGALNEKTLSEQRRRSLGVVVSL